MTDSSEWVTRLHAGRLTRRERRALRTWIAESTDNAREFLRAETIWRLSGGLAHDANVQAQLSALRERPPARTRLPWLAITAATAGACALAVAGYLWTASHSTQWYVTAAGEQRLVTLPDGSTLAVNTASRIGVRFDKQSRALILERGEVLFQAAKDPQRPFIVRAGHGNVRAVGTRFNVLLGERDDVTVSVLEGRVEVDTRPAAAASMRTPTMLDAGESAAYERTGRIVEADAARASRERINAWREGKLRFDAWSLADAVHEHNRYAKKPLTFASPELANAKVSGVFHIGDTPAMITALKALIELDAVDEGDRIVLYPRRER